jgi:murein L,D-transpeptidase YcbB/YkuD
MRARAELCMATALGLVMALAAAPPRVLAQEQVQETPRIEVQEQAQEQALETPREASPIVNAAPVAEEPPVAQEAAVEPAAPAVAAEAEFPASIVPMPPEVAVDLTAPTAPAQNEQAQTELPQAPALSPRQAALKKAIEARASERGTVAQRRVREGIAHVYEARNWQPLWLHEDRWTEQAQSAIARLERAGDDALDLRAAPAPVLRATDPDALALVDLALSDSVATYARQASGARIDPRTISNQITSKPDIVEPARSLVEVAAASDAGAALENYNPRHRGYLTLRDKLAELRHAAPAVAQRAIPMGPVLKPGMKDDRVPLIRARFGLDQGGASEELLYDTRVAEAVAGFQKEHGIPASGTLTARTVSALSGGVPDRLGDEIIANMERWRWMPRDMGVDRIEVNIPDYKVRVYHGDAIVHEARVIVGKPQTPTPIFSNSMQFLIVNPYWNVPPSIIKKEMMPRLKDDPTYLQRLGYEVFYHKGQMGVRQPPGERNALGWIKFMFPNEHSVYLHDTPSRALFGNAKRAFSHGCVRVDQPFALAEIVLGAGWTEARVKSLKGGGERTVKMPKPLPIHIGYFSAFVDAQGKLQLREDIYGYSQKVKAALGLAA